MQDKQDPELAAKGEDINMISPLDISSSISSSSSDIDKVDQLRRKLYHVEGMDAAADGRNNHHAYDYGEYCELQYKCHLFSIFSIENAERMELPMKNDDFVLKNGVLFCNSRYAGISLEQAVFGDPSLRADDDRPRPLDETEIVSVDHVRLQGVEDSDSWWTDVQYDNEPVTAEQHTQAPSAGTTQSVVRTHARLMKAAVFALPLLEAVVSTGTSLTLSDSSYSSVHIDPLLQMTCTPSEQYFACIAGHAGLSAYDAAYACFAEL